MEQNELMEPRTPGGVFCSVAEAAAMLCCSPPTVHKLVREGELSSFRPWRAARKMQLYTHEVHLYARRQRESQRLVQERIRALEAAIRGY